QQPAAALLAVLIAAFTAGLVPALRLLLDQHPHRPARFTGIDPRHPAGHIHHQPLAAHDIGALADHHIALQRDGVGSHVEYAGVAARGLVLLRDRHAAARFQPLDLRRSARPRRRRLHGGAGRARPTAGATLAVLLAVLAALVL